MAGRYFVDAAVLCGELFAQGFGVGLAAQEAVAVEVVAHVVQALDAAVALAGVLEAVEQGEACALVGRARARGGLGAGSGVAVESAGGTAALDADAVLAADKWRVVDYRHGGLGLLFVSCILSGDEAQALGAM